MRVKAYSRPRDRSLQAFKDWVHGETYRLNPNGAGTVILEPWLDDQQWIEYWTKFWAKADRASRSRNQDEG